MSNLLMTRRSVDGVAILDLSGDIRMGQGNAYLQQTLRSMIEQNETKVLINMAGVSYIDSSGLGELVAGYTTIGKSGGELKLLNVTERVKDLMMITKLLTVFDVYDSEAEAVASFERGDHDYTTGPLDQNLLVADAVA